MDEKTLIIANQENTFVQFTHENKFDVSKFDAYPFDMAYNGPIFSTNHNGVAYKWRIFIQPNGGRFREQLDSGEWCESQEDRENIIYALEFIAGPLSSVNASYSFKVKPSDNSVAVLHQPGSTEALFDSECSSWVEQITAKQDFEKDGKFFEDGFLRVIVEIKMSFDLFDPTKILQKLKAEISLEQENITTFPSFLFDSIETEPSYGICLKLVCGAEKRVFYCIPQILEINSDYFRKLLNSNGDFKENRESLEFVDFDPEGVRAALRYIYLKELPQNFEEVAEVCVPVAHTFLLPGLVLQCEKVLVGHLSAENDVDMAVLAEIYGMPLLKNMALNSIALHFNEVMKNARIVKKIEDAQLCTEIWEVVTYHSRSATSGSLLQSAGAAQF